MLGDRELNYADFLVFMLAFGAFCFVLGMAIQHREGPPLILIEPQKPAPRIAVKVTDCDSIPDAIVWCRAQKRTGKVKP